VDRDDGPEVNIRLENGTAALYLFFWLWVCFIEVLE
jgi:hypothetical protein